MEPSFECTRAGPRWKRTGELSWSNAKNYGDGLGELSWSRANVVGAGLVRLGQSGATGSSNSGENRDHLVHLVLGRLSTQKQGDRADLAPLGGTHKTCTSAYTGVNTGG